MILDNTLYYGIRLLKRVIISVSVETAFVRPEEALLVLYFSVFLYKFMLNLYTAVQIGHVDPHQPLTSFSNSCLAPMREVWSMLSRALLMLRAHTCSPSWTQRAVTFPPWRENLRRVLSSDSLGNKNNR